VWIEVGALNFKQNGVKIDNVLALPPSVCCLLDVVFEEFCKRAAQIEASQSFTSLLLREQPPFHHIGHSFWTGEFDEAKNIIHHVDLYSTFLVLIGLTET
jgi:hypothetical protein